MLMGVHTRTDTLPVFLRRPVGLLGITAGSIIDLAIRPLAIGTQSRKPDNDMSTSPYVIIITKYQLAIEVAPVTPPTIVDSRR